MIITDALYRIVRTRYKRFNRRLGLSKRQQFVIVTLICTFGLLLTQTVQPEQRGMFLGLLAVFSYGLSAFALRDDLRGGEWLTLLALPTLFTVGTAVFYFLLPVRWLTRLPVAVVYAVGMYALLLT